LDHDLRLLFPEPSVLDFGTQSKWSHRPNRCNLADKTLVIVFIAIPDFEGNMAQGRTRRRRQGSELNHPGGRTAPAILWDVQSGLFPPAPPPRSMHASPGRKTNGFAPERRNSIDHAGGLGADACADGHRSTFVPPRPWLLRAGKPEPSRLGGFPAVSSSFRRQKCVKLLWFY